MPERLLIARPERVVASQTGTANLDRLLTPEPKEAFAFPADAVTRDLDLDFGANVQLDTIYLGYHTVAAIGPSWSFRTVAALGGAVSATHFAGVSLVPVGNADPRQSMVRLAEPVAGRYFRLSINPGNVAFTASVFAAGPSLQPALGHEWDSGRLIEDTGSVERRVDGGFGIDEGVAAGGYEWSFDSLQGDEVATLYRWAKERRTTRSVLVVEAAGGAGDFPSDAIHWGLFDKLEPYRRRDPGNTRWALRVRDWA